MGIDERTLHSGTASLRRVDNCPSCANEGVSPHSSQATGFSVLMDGAEFTQDDYRIVECGLCGLLYRNVVPSDEVLSAYYAKTDYRKWQIDGLFPTERATVAALSDLPAGSKILDFGCSSGRLMTAVGSAYERYGIEVNRDAAVEAEAKGITIIDSNQWRETDLRFDAIVMVDVFEHLVHPAEVMHSLTRLLRQGGCLIVVTGNGDSLACRRNPAQFWYFRTLEHLTIITKKASEYLEKECGLVASSWVELSHYDFSLKKRLAQHFRHWVYWQFQNKTLMSRVVLRWIPKLSRARLWTVAPELSCTKDHVVIVYRKTFK
jgi:2-polyprenyl-3-methyl-5-hydroxy-6-metoxy-1,4-benzoquinol methylase